VTAHLTTSQRALARRLRAKGMSLRVIAKEIGCSHSGIDVMLKGQARAPRPDTWTPREGHLTAGDREEILLGLHRGESMSQIARDLNRSASSVTREVKANGGRKRYRIWPAYERARTRTLRPKPAKLDKGPLCDKVTRGLESLWSPEEIARRLRREFPDDSSMQVSHRRSTSRSSCKGGVSWAESLPAACDRGARPVEPEARPSGAARSRTW